MAGLEKQQYEHKHESLFRDTRTIERRAISWLTVPENILWIMLSLSVALFFISDLPLGIPLLFEPILLASLGVAIVVYYAQKNAGLPLRYPKSSGLIDPKELDPATGKKLEAKGIIYLGNDLKTNEEVWTSDVMARTHMMFLGTTGSGKALPNDAPVLTPFGFKKNGDLVIGDILLLPNGETTKVVGVYPQGLKLIYGITLANNRAVECCDEHLWLIKHENNERIARTDEIISLVKKGESVEIPCVDILAGQKNYTSSDVAWSKITKISPKKYKLSTCILVDTKEHLFITGDINGDLSAGIVTHNTEFLLSVVCNALIHGSGFIYVDGKADSSLYGKIYSMARQFGREDDVRVINFQTGAKDIFGAQPFKISNTMNPFAVGSAGMLTNLVVSLMSSGKGDMWENRAISFIEALMKPLVFLRDTYGFMLDVDVIRSFFDLNRLEELTWRDAAKYPGLEQSLGGMESYLRNVPGYNKNNFQKQAETTHEQHGFITMQLIRTFNSLADTYGYIMKTPLAEIDFLDVFLNRRILVVLLPALEKSPAELQNLGKIIVASIKATMAVGLGSQLEGSWAQVLESKPTTSPSPFMCVLDEYGYYSVEGFSVVPAQARSLGFSAIFAGQDLPAFQKSSEKESESTLANTNTKVCGKLICTKTAKYFTDYSGQGTYTRTGGFEVADGVSGGFKETGTASIERMDRVTLDDLMQQGSGRWHLWFGPDIIKLKSFFCNPSKVQTIRVNRLLRVSSPSFDAVKLYRDANRNFRKALATPEVGLASKLNQSPVHDFMILGKWHRDFISKPGPHQAVCALAYYLQDSEKRTAVFEDLMESMRNRPQPFEEFGKEDVEFSSLKDSRENDEFNKYLQESTKGLDSNIKDPFNDSRNPSKVDLSYLGMDALSGLDFNVTSSTNVTEVNNDSKFNDQTNRKINNEFSISLDDDVEGNVLDNFITDDTPSEPDSAWSIDENSNDMSADVSDIETFKGATVFGVQGVDNIRDVLGITEIDRKPADADQGQLDRDKTELGLNFIERQLGSTDEEAQFNSEVTARKIAEFTKYPITPPAVDKVSAESLTDVARRVLNQLEKHSAKEEI